MQLTLALVVSTAAAQERGDFKKLVATAEPEAVAEPKAAVEPTTPEPPAVIHELVTMARGHATISMSLVVKDAEDLSMTLVLPGGGVATGLSFSRTWGAGQWLGQLLPAGLAENRYWGSENASEGGLHERTLLAWAGEHSVQLWSRGPRKTRSFTINALTPTSYEDGADVLKIDPPVADSLFSFEVQGEGADSVWVRDAEALSHGRWRVSAGKIPKVNLDRAHPPLLGGRIAVVPITGRRAYWHQGVEAAARLSRKPVEARVVILIDASRSLSAAELEAERATAMAYLSHLPDAHVHLAFFDRSVRPLGRSLESTPEALKRLSDAPLQRRNGSAVDLALEHAKKVLEASAGDGPKRILLLTDTHTRSALTTSRLAGLMADSGALVHVASVSQQPETASLARLDAHPWTAATRGTKGLVWGLGKAGQAGLQEASEELVRPVRLDKLVWTISGPGGKDMTDRDNYFPTSLAEGDSYETTEVLAQVPEALSIEGELWTERLSTRLLPDAAEASRWAALSPAADSPALTDADKKLLAKLGRSVSPLQSLLAESPGPHRSDGMGGVGGASSYSSHDVGIGNRQLRAPTIANRSEELAALLASAWQRCSPGGGATRMIVETSANEIVDVPLIEPLKADPGARECLEQATWALDLPASFAAPFQHFDFTLSRPAGR